MYCGLPLPGDTGLPFHVNAPLALSSNRRDVWRASRLRDADGAATELAEWNERLLHDAVPPRVAEVTPAGLGHSDLKVAGSTVRCFDGD